MSGSLASQPEPAIPQQLALQRLRCECNESENIEDVEDNASADSEHGPNSHAHDLPAGNLVDEVDGSCDSKGKGRIRDGRAHLDNSVERAEQKGKFNSRTNSRANVICRIAKAREVAKALADSTEELDLDEDDCSAEKGSNNGVRRQIACDIDKREARNAVDTGGDSSDSDQRNEADATEELVHGRALNQAGRISTSSVVSIAQVEHGDRRASEDMDVAHDSDAGACGHQPRNILADTLDTLGEDIAFLFVRLFALAVLMVGMNSKDDEKDNADEKLPCICADGCLGRTKLPHRANDT